MTENIDKNELRRTMRVRRSDYVAGLRPQHLDIAFSRIPAALDILLTPGKTVAGYVATGSEADPMRLLEQAFAMGCNTALPHVTSRVSPMRFLRWSPGDPLVDGPFKLKQPVADAPEYRPDIVLVPLVAFDATMTRLGQGAGHYDRALSLLDQALAIGIAWSVQQCDTLPADPWDIPLDAVLTEKYWMSV